MNTLKYKGFLGAVAFSEADGVFFGKIEGIDGLVNFEGESVQELTAAFHDAVDDYLAYCQEKAIRPQVSPVFRKAIEADVIPATRILRQAAETMMAEGKQQWDESYPTEIHVREDLERGVAYVLELDGEVVGYCAVVFDGEPAYDVIDGAWLSERRYVVVHRMAVRSDRKGLGLGRRFMQAVETYARERGITSFKVDTNHDNQTMQALLHRLGFTLCGQIKYQKGSRLAYEKLL